MKDSKSNKEMAIVKKDVVDSLGAQVVGSASGALVGLAIGGPAGAIAGAVGAPLVTFAAEAIARKQKRAHEALKKSAFYTDETIGSFVNKLAKDEEKIDLALKILKIASESQFDEKVNLLGALLADVYQKESNNMHQHLILVRIIENLDPLHLRVLEFICDSNERGQGQIGCEPSAILEAFPDSSFLVRSVVRTLELHGLILDEARLNPQELAGKVYWIVSDLGEVLLNIVKSCIQDS